MLDGRLLSIMRPDLELASLESMPPNVQLRYGTSIDTLHNFDDGVSLTLSDGSAQEADLLIGAEGIHSPLRGRIFGPETDYLHYLGYHTAAFIIHDPAMNTEVGRQFSLSDSADRQAGIYALRGGDVAIFTVHRANDRNLPASPRGELRRRYTQLGWFLPPALAQCPADLYYDEVSQIIMPQWHSGRTVVVGDAAHAVSLLAGQGASLAIAGAESLVRALTTADSIDTALADYERAWRPQVQVQQEAGRRAAAWFVPSNRLWLGVRRTVLWLMAVPGFDRLLGNRLAGMTGAKVKP